jgi:alpha-mannosidase
MRTLQDIKEVLIVHHSHTDIGYTHPQPILWDLERRFIDRAIDLCEETANWPGPSQLRWTCETTGPVVHWLERASGRQIERFARLATERRISVGAMFCNITPLYDAEQLARSLYPVRELRRQFGIPIATAINHDVNGLPWPITQLLLDADVQMLLMGINIHFGNFPLARPMAFRWQGSDGRPLLVFNGEHYGIFQRVCRIRENSTNAMAQGLKDYFRQLRARTYPYDFMYLSLTHALFWDNNPPYPQAIAMIKRWNDEGRAPVIRFITPEDLLTRLQKQPEPLLPLHAGDWTDWWNFGCASAAVETRLNRESRARLAAAGLLDATRRMTDKETRKLVDEAYWNLNLYDEHTWGHFASIPHPEWDGVIAQWYHKAHYAYQARSLSSMLLRDGMDRLAVNPVAGEGCQGLLLLNAAPVSRNAFVRVPTAWLDGSWQHFCSKMHSIDVEREGWNDKNSRLIGPIELPACGYRVVPISRLSAARKPKGIKISNNVIESPWHRLTFDKSKGRITSLVDKVLGWDLVDHSSPWSFFGFVQETVDSKRDSCPPPYYGRNAFFRIHYDGLRQDVKNWKPNWPVRRLRPPALKGCRVEKAVDGVSLVLEWAAPGVERLQQRIKLFVHRAAIELSVSFRKQDIATPESIYLSFPCHLTQWRAHFDTAGLPVELDAEQLPGSCRDWVTVGQWVSLHDRTHGLTLACPDAPMVQIGDFNFGKKQSHVPRKKNPLLLAWPMNNYWNTNFRASQPGWQRFRYELTTHGPFDTMRAATAGWEACSTVEAHPVLTAPTSSEHRLIELDGAGVLPLAVRDAGDGGIIVRLANVSNTSAQTRVRLSGKNVAKAFRTSTLEEDQQSLPVSRGWAVMEMSPRSVVAIRLKRKP